MERTPRLLIRFAALVIVGLGGAMWAPSAVGACGSWQSVSGAYVRSGSLADVSASSSTDAWAVGWRDVPWGTTPLVEHWDGHSWIRVPSVRPALSVRLDAVVAIAANDVWAAGVFGSGKRALMEHWDGSTWRRVALPATAPQVTVRDMTAISPNDIWAVGNGYNWQRPRTLHYDGTRWKVIPSATPSAASTPLSGVSAIARDDVWAIGVTWKHGNELPYAEHWAGDAWTRIRIPLESDWAAQDPGSGLPVMGVAAIGRSDAWAVGPLAAHWDGTRWTVPPQPPTPNDGGLTAVAASGANDVWAVGYEARSYYGAPKHIVTWHWNGTTWTPFAVRRTAGQQFLTDVTYAPGTAGTYWAVGEWLQGGSGHGTWTTPLIESYC